MDKKVFAAAFALLCLGSIKALALPSKAPAKSAWKRTIPSKGYLEIKSGYFFFSSSTMREVYNQGGIDVQFCGAYPITSSLRIYGSFELLKRSGHSLSGEQKTSFWATPLSIGMQPVVTFNPIHPISLYVTFGPRYFITQAHNQSSFVQHKMHSNGFGGFLNTGIMVTLRDHLTMDFFGEYSYGRLHYKSDVENTEGTSAQVGGYTFGGGFSCVF